MGAQLFSFPGLTVSIPGLERALHQYTLDPSEKPFDLKSVPLATAPIIEQRAGKRKESHFPGLTKNPPF